MSKLSPNEPGACFNSDPQICSWPTWEPLPLGTGTTLPSEPLGHQQRQSPGDPDGSGGILVSGAAGSSVQSHCARHENLSRLHYSFRSTQSTMGNPPGRLNSSLLCSVNPCDYGPSAGGREQKSRDAQARHRADDTESEMSNLVPCLW